MASAVLAIPLPWLPSALCSSGFLRPGEGVYAAAAEYVCMHVAYILYTYIERFNDLAWIGPIPETVIFPAVTDVFSLVSRLARVVIILTHLPMDLPIPGAEVCRAATPQLATTPAFANDQSMISQSA